MEHRTRLLRREPAVPEREITVIGSRFTCDRCGKVMPQYNSTHWAEEGMVPRSRLRVYLNREKFSGDGESDQALVRDYCDECLPGIWKAVTELLAYPTEVVRGDE